MLGEVVPSVLSAEVGKLGEVVPAALSVKVEPVAFPAEVEKLTMLGEIE